jgi:hypothetical protein
MTDYCYYEVFGGLVEFGGEQPGLLLGEFGDGFVLV